MLIMFKRIQNCKIRSIINTKEGYFKTVDVARNKIIPLEKSFNNSI